MVIYLLIKLMKLFMLYVYNSMVMFIWNIKFFLKYFFIFYFVCFYLFIYYYGKKKGKNLMYVYIFINLIVCVGVFLWIYML